MTPKELMLAAIRHERLPAMAVTTYDVHPFASGHIERVGPTVDPVNDCTERSAHNGGITCEQIAQFPEIMKAVAAAPNVGMLCKSIPVWGPAFQEFITVEETTDESGTQRVMRLETPKGELRTVHRTSPGSWGVEIVERPLKTDDDIEKYLSIPRRPVEIDLSPVKECYEKLGERGLVYVGFSSPVEMIASRFEYEDFMTRCALDLPVIKRLVECEFERIKDELAVMLEQAAGYDILFYSGEEIVTAGMMSPHVFRELAIPCYKHLVSMVREAGHLAALHCIGGVREVLDDILEVGFDVLEPMEPPPYGDLDLDEAFDYLDGRICLAGYIQDRDLSTAKPGEVRTQVEAIREMVAGRSGYIMMNTAPPRLCPLPPRYVRNYVEFIEAASEAL